MRNDVREQISFIIYDNSVHDQYSQMNVRAYSKVEIHFNNPVESVCDFFNAALDNNMLYLASIDLSHFDASLVTRFEKMFYYCRSLNSIDFSNFNTSSAIDMSQMFQNCSSLVSLDLSSFDTRNVENIYSMFYNCVSLVSLDISNFNLENIINSANTFDELNSIKYINIFNAKDKDYIISGNKLNKNDDLIVCQKKKGIITNKNVINDCCNYDINSKTCESNYITFNFYNEMNVHPDNNTFMNKISYIKYSDEMIINETFKVNSSYVGFI